MTQPVRDDDRAVPGGVGLAGALPCRWGAAVVLLLAGWLFFAGLGSRELYSSHEARAAMDALSLLDPDSDGVPRLFDGRAETQKPPLYYWLAALAMNAGIPPEWAVRLPAALAGWGGVALLVFGCRTMGRPVAGLVAACVLMTSIHFPWLARIARIDMPLAFTTTAAGFGFVLAMQGRRGFLLAAYLACAAGVLLKGPIGLALPGAIVAGLLLAEGRWPAFWEWKAWWILIRHTGAWWGLPLVLALTLPVFLWLEQATQGQFCHDFFWLHNVQRGLGGSRLRSHPWWLYGPYLLLYLLPASPLLLLAFRPQMWRGDALARTGLAWLCAVVALLSAARFKRADYLLPAYPGAALFLGCVLERAAILRPRLAVAALACPLIAWAFYLHVHLPAEAAFRDYRPLATLARSYPLPVVLFRTEAHALVFRLGRPSSVLVEWPRLREALQSGPCLLVMPPQVAEEARRQLPGFALETLGGTESLAGGRHERPLLLIRAARQDPPHAATADASSHCRSTPGRAAPGPAGR